MAMKKIYFFLLMLFVSTSIFAQTATAPSYGTGTSNDPYEIETLNNLYWIYVDDSRWDKHYVQMGNIDASDTEDWFDGQGWFPIGTETSPFTGSYDGGGYSISNLFIGEKEVEDFNYGVGLFGLTSEVTTIQNLTVSAYALGYQYVAVLVGINAGSITNCNVSGEIAGEVILGGITSENTGFIFNCYSSVEVSGISSLGGLVGVNENNIDFSGATGLVKKTSGTTTSQIGGLVGVNNSDISNSFSSVNVSASGTLRVIAGGFVGENTGSISNSYSRSTLSTGSTSTFSSNHTGGFAGKNSSEITNCFSAGLVSAASTNKGGLVSLNTGTISNSFWDSETSGIATGSNGTPLTTAQMKTKRSFTSVDWDFLEVWAIQASQNNGYPFLPSWFKWLGGSNSWTTNTNWDKGTIPSSDDYISISAQSVNPRITSSVSINYMVIGNGAELTTSSSGVLTIKDDGVLAVNPEARITSNGTITNSEGVDGLLIESDDISTGSVILNNSGVLATVQRYVEGAQTFHLISSPVSGQSISNFLNENTGVIAQNGSLYAMRHYIETTGWSSFYTLAQSGNLEPGTTYSVGLASPGTLEFKGTLNSSNITQSIDSTVYGWNGIGNPFASALNAKVGESSLLYKFGNQLSITHYGLYIWNPTTKQYEVINGVPELTQDYIASGQGFIVKSKTGGGSVTFETGMRAHQNPDFYKSGKVSEGWSKLILQVENAASQVLKTSIAFNADMTSDLDVGYDAGLFSENSSYKFYTRMPVEENDLNLMVQALPNNWDEVMVIPIGLQYNVIENKVVTFSVSSMTLPDDLTVWLEDREAGVFTVINSESYSATISPDAEPLGRFFLHIGMAVTSVEISTPDDLNYCEDEVVDVTFTASAVGVNYQWYRNEELIPDATSKTYNATEEGSYKVVVSVGGSSAESESKMIIINALPSVTIPVDFAVCLGEVVTLTAAGDADLFEWDNDVINGEEFIPTETTTYTLTATITATGCHTTEEVTITVNPLPEVDVPDNFEICFGEAVTLTATGNANTYEWDNDVINGEEFTPTETTTYTVTATITSTGCQTTEEVTITVNPLPELMLASDEISITILEQYLFDAGEGFESYLWFDGSNEQTYLFVGSDWGIGVYDVWAEITNQFGCSTRDSAIVNVGPTSVEVISPWNFNLYPNPSQGEFNLDISGLTSQKVNITILNSLGNMVYQKEYIPSYGVLQDIIRLKDKAKGVFLITISDGKNKLSKRIVIN
jgi:hypothetical protein